MRGRRPKPTRLKMLTGNPGKRPLNHDEPRPEANIPECPPELGPLARQEWDRLVGELAALRLLTNLDRAALAAYCGAYRSEERRVGKECRLEGWQYHYIKKLIIINRVTNLL